MLYLSEAFVQPVSCARLQVRLLERNNGNKAAHVASKRLLKDPEWLREREGKC